VCYPEGRDDDYLLLEPAGFSIPTFVYIFFFFFFFCFSLHDHPTCILKTKKKDLQQATATTKNTSTPSNNVVAYVLSVQ
jgi:hypothetical protein